MARQREARVLAQAKINLFLRVLARETSGYHQLETIFQRLALGDDVTVRVGAPGMGRSIDSRGADVGPPERNLAWRAAMAYADAAGWPTGFAIEIDKRIPVGGGLGGGSADAGAVLRCLDRLNPRPLGPTAVLRLAVDLGADVPFLTSELALALAWGRGERLLALPALPARQAHLGVFERGVATAEVFRTLAADREPPRPTPIVWAPDRFATWDAVALVATNDLEPVVFAARPEIGELRRFFSACGAEFDASHGPAAAPGDSAPIALMSGSGATVFLLTPRLAEQWEFVVQPASSGSPPPPGDGLAIVATETATCVAEVELSG